jgi:hypothetical protein
MKLKDWADKTGIKYLTAYRWFKAGKLPVPAYQSESGTIIVQDDAENPSEQAMAGNSNQNDAMSLFLKKTVEFSKNNSTVEDFAAFVISNFQLKLQGSDSPKYSKNKPKTEDIQKHFQKFLPDKESVDHLKNIKTLIKDSRPSASTEVDVNLVHDLNTLISMDAVGLDDDARSETFCEDNIEGTVTRSVDLNSTPQQINYTGSINPALNNSSLAFSSSLPATGVATSSQLYMASAASAPSSFRLSQKEITELSDVGTKAMESFSKPRRRGRPSKKADK